MTTEPRVRRAKHAVLGAVARVYYRGCDEDKHDALVGYPQTMYLAMKLPRRLQRAARWLCRHAGGHELSDTDRGYGGGGFIDRWCRWCNQHIEVPVEESPGDGRLMGLHGRVDDR